MTWLWAIFSLTAGGNRPGHRNYRAAGAAKNKKRLCFLSSTLFTVSAGACLPAPFGSCWEGRLASPAAANVAGATAANRGGTRTYAQTLACARLSPAASVVWALFLVRIKNLALGYSCIRP